MKHMTRQEYVASLRRKSSGFSKGASVYRGVTRSRKHGRWRAIIGRVEGSKDPGTYSTEVEAAAAYDIAAIKCWGINATTNFDIRRYDTKPLCGPAHNSVENESKPVVPLLTYGPVVSGSSSKDLQVQQVVQQHQQPTKVSVDQTDEDSQSLQTRNNSQATDGLVSTNSQLQERQMIYQQQTQRSWDDTTSHHHHHHQDGITPSVISDSLGQKFMQSNIAATMHSVVLRNFMGFNDGGTSHNSASETSGGMSTRMPGSSNNNLMGSSGHGGGGCGGISQSPKHH